MDKFGIKGIYDCFIQTIDSLTLGDKTFSPGETVFYFDDIQEFYLQANNTVKNATGGIGDLAFVNWDEVKSLYGTISVGVRNKVLMGASFKSLLNYNNNLKIFPNDEKLTTDINGECELSFEPSSDITIYKLEEGKRTGKVLDYTIIGTTLKIEELFSDIEVQYSFTYTENKNEINIGKNDLKNHFKLVGKFYYTDELTKEQKTAIIEIPKLIINSNFKLDLGRDANPLTSTLYFEALCEDRFNKNFVNIYFLNEMV